MGDNGGEGSKSLQASRSRRHYPAGGLGAPCKRGPLQQLSGTTLRGAGPVLGMPGWPPRGRAAVGALDCRRERGHAAAAAELAPRGSPPERRLSEASAPRRLSRPGSAGCGVAGQRPEMCLPAAPPRESAPTLPGRHLSSRRPGNRRRQGGITWGRHSRSRDTAGAEHPGKKSERAGRSGREPSWWTEAGACCPVSAGGRTLHGRVPLLRSTTSIDSCPQTWRLALCPALGMTPSRLNP